MSHSLSMALQRGRGAGPQCLYLLCTASQMWHAGYRLHCATADIHRPIRHPEVVHVCLQSSERVLPCWLTATAFFVLQIYFTCYFGVVPTTPLRQFIGKIVTWCGQLNAQTMHKAVVTTCIMSNLHTSL